MEFAKFVKKTYLSFFIQSNILSGLRVTELFLVDRTAIDEANFSYHCSPKWKMVFLFLQMMKMYVHAAPILILPLQDTGKKTED